MLQIWEIPGQFSASKEIASGGPRAPYFRFGWIPFRLLHLLLESQLTTSPTYPLNERESSNLEEMCRILEASIESLVCPSFPLVLAFSLVFSLHIL